MTTNNNLYALYQKALLSDIDNGSFRAVSIDESIPHRVGCTNDGFPMLFVECEDTEKISDIKLSLFRVLFTRKCSIADIENKTVSEKIFTLIQMSSKDRELIAYFFQVVSIVMKRLPVRPKVSILKEELSKIIEIFNSSRKFSKDLLKGLWAELLIIERSSNPEYLIRAWHESPEDRYDFNDSRDKIEVKSTSGDYRSHVFSLEQLSPNDSSNLLVASVFVNATGIGKNIFDLVDMISIKIKNTECNLKLVEIVYKTIGPNVEECLSTHFDYIFAVDNLRYYDSKVIPSIKKEAVPPFVSSVHFRSDLTEIPSVDVSDMDYNSMLFDSL